LEDFSKAITFKPSSEELAYYKGATLYKLKRHQEAITELKRATMLNPQNADAYLLLSYSYATLGNQTDAKFAAQKAVDLINP
jgi:Flp pilus assembly protein TadD